MRTLLAFAAAFVMLAGLKSPFIVVGDKPFTYKKDSVMTYSDVRIGSDGSESTDNASWTVGKIEGDKTYVDYSAGTFVFSYADGFFCWGTVREDGEDVGMRVFKLGAKKGDTWAPGADAPKDVVTSYLGDEEITVVGGKFTCKKTVLDVKGQLKVTFWFADKVGLVKATKELILDKDTSMTIAKIELQKFVEGK